MGRKIPDFFFSSKKVLFFFFLHLMKTKAQNDALISLSLGFQFPPPPNTVLGDSRSVFAGSKDIFKSEIIVTTKDKRREIQKSI